MTDRTGACPTCGAPATEGIKFCGLCGEPFTAPGGTAGATLSSVTSMKKTMMGIVPEAVPDAESAPPSRGSRAPSRVNQTMLGMPVVQRPLEPEPEPELPIEPAKKPIPPAVTNRTMLGMAAIPNPAGARAPGAPSGAGPPPPVAPETWSAWAEGPGTPPVVVDPTARQRQAIVYDPDGESIEAPAAPARKKGRGGLLVVLVLFVAVLLLGGGALAYYFVVYRKPPDIVASVVHSDAGEQLQLEVPSASGGTKVRFGGEERDLRAGRAEFPLAADALSLGANELPIAIVSPDGDVTEARVVLEVPFRVRADLDAVDADPPGFDVVVDALPGSEVSLGSDRVELDRRGHGVRRIPIPEDGTGASFEHRVRFRIVPPDRPPVDRELHTSIPYASLQVDRPGAEVVTDRDSVEVAGAVNPEATVRIGSTEVVVAEGRFLYRMPLPEQREYEVVVVARQPGRAPRSETIRIRRVADLAAEAARYPADPELTYGRISQNPDIYRGRRVSFVGYVYNVTVGQGRSDLQVLLRDCPTGERCSLWVHYPAATEAEEGTWVRIFGEVAGRQQYRTASNRILSVPRIDAVFILPERR